MSYFQITGDIDISHKTLMEKALRPSLVFLEGDISQEYAKELYLKLTLLPKDIFKLTSPMSEDYFIKTGYGEYVTDYDKLVVTEYSDHTLGINIPETLNNLKRCITEEHPDRKPDKDNSKFIMDFYDDALRSLEITKKYRNLKHVKGYT